MEKEKMEKNTIKRKKYEKGFFKCGDCKFNGDIKEIVVHGDAKKHYEKTRSLGIQEYVPTIEEAQNRGDVIFDEGKRWHEPCGEYLSEKRNMDKKGNVLSVDFLCKACGQKFKLQI